MFARLYQLLLHLYPDHHRTTFGAEMTAVFQQARADARNENVAGRTVFYLREFSGLITDAFQLQIQTTGTRNEPWVWSLETPVTAILLYSFCVWRAEEMGLWGFFFPGTYLLVALLGGVGAWLVGRECAIIRSWHRWRRALVFLFVFALIVAFVARATHDAWAGFLLSRDAPFALYRPGLAARVQPGPVAR